MAWMDFALDEAQPQIEVFRLALSSQWIDITSRKETTENTGEHFIKENWE